MHNSEMAVPPVRENTRPILIVSPDADVADASVSSPAAFAAHPLIPVANNARARRSARSFLVFFIFLSSLNVLNNMNNGGCRSFFRKDFPIVHGKNDGAVESDDLVIVFSVEENEVRGFSLLDTIAVTDAQVFRTVNRYEVKARCEVRVAQHDRRLLREKRISTCFRSLSDTSNEFHSPDSEKSDVPYFPSELPSLLIRAPVLLLYRPKRSAVK